MKRCGLGKTGEYSDREPIEYGMKCADEGFGGGGGDHERARPINAI